jgi:hypothetical protein
MMVMIGGRGAPQGFHRFSRRRRGGMAARGARAAGFDRIRSDEMIE